MRYSWFQVAPEVTPGVTSVPLTRTVHSSGAASSRAFRIFTLQNAVVPSGPVLLKLICLSSWLNLKAVIVELLIISTG